ncbi:unnamed protein product, partial [Nesidiocoris tenuis]
MFRIRVSRAISAMLITAFAMLRGKIAFVRVSHLGLRALALCASVTFGIPKVASRRHMGAKRRVPDTTNRFIKTFHPSQERDLWTLYKVHLFALGS